MTLYIMHYLRQVCVLKLILEIIMIQLIYKLWSRLNITMWCKYEICSFNLTKYSIYSAHVEFNEFMKNFFFQGFLNQFLYRLALHFLNNC